MSNVLDPLPGVDGAEGWRAPAGTALLWCVAARAVSPVATDLVSSVAYLVLPLVAGDLDQGVVFRGVWGATLVVWAVGMGLLVWGTTRLAVAMRGGPRPGPLFDLGPPVVALTLLLLLTLVLVGAFFPDNAAFGLSRAILAPIPTVLVLLLTAATLARAGEAGLTLIARVLVLVPLGEGVLSAVAALTNRTLAADSVTIATLSAVRTAWVLLGEGAIITLLVYAGWGLRGPPGRIQAGP